MKQYVRLAVASLFCAGTMCLTGCASIVSGRTQEVTFKSVPDGATVIINGREMGKTPFTYAIDRKADQTLTFQKEGYKTETLPLATRTNGWFFGNIIFGLYGLLSSTTDSVTGAVYEYSPTFYQITLNPTTAVSSSAQQSSDVRTFIVGNYRSLVEDMEIGKGQYINSLWSLLKIASDKQAEALVKLKELAKSNKDISEFAAKVSEQIISK